MPAARTNAHSDAPTNNRNSASEKDMLINLLDALQSGRLRVLDPPVENAPFRPRMEIYDDPASPNTVATFELPGVTSEHLTLGVKDDVLVVRGQRGPRFPFHSQSPFDLDSGSPANMPDTRHSRAAAQYRRMFPWRELRYGNFHRNLHLPPGVDTTQMTASLTDGLLVVSWVRPSAPAVQRGPSAGASPGNRVMYRERDTKDESEEDAKSQVLGNDSQRKARGTC
ncbi:HSP20-like chaperone [Mycena kentingensis (nom. inval.)]|nr:HSP20-like chaperone [Mycena kentingensis (nom. inval.)]